MVRGRAYFDTSAIVKRYVAEAGSSRTRALIRRHRVVASVLTPIEALSALARRHAAGDLSDRDFAAIVSRLGGDRHTWELVEVSGPVLARAEDLVRTGTLRTLDAIHISSALVFESAAGTRLPFITGDHRQRGAAALARLEVVWVAG